MKPTIFGTRVTTLNCLHKTLDQHSTFVYCCCSYKPLRAEERKGEGEREREREPASARSAVLAISLFTWFCVGNTLSNMFKLKLTTYTSSYVSLY